MSKKENTGYWVSLQYRCFFYPLSNVTRFRGYLKSNPGLVLFSDWPCVCVRVCACMHFFLHLMRTYYDEYNYNI